MLFLLLPHIDEAGWQALPKGVQTERIAAFPPFGEALRSAGAFVAAYQPQPSYKTATVRVVDGKTAVSEGPLAESAQQLSGVYVIEVSDREAALSWAARLPASSYGAVEVRPVFAPPAPAGRS
jgi:hypothetical protein